MIGDSTMPKNKAGNKGEAKKTIQVRATERELRVPWQKNDEGIDEPLETIAKESVVVDRMKEAMKPHAKALSDAFDKLAEGRPANVACEEWFDHDANTVTVVRTDTNVVLEEREMTEDDRQLNSFDREEKVPA
jgi:hypothetical protein